MVILTFQVLKRYVRYYVGGLAGADDSTQDLVSCGLRPAEDSYSRIFPPGQMWYNLGDTARQKAKRRTVFATLYVGVCVVVMGPIAAVVRPLLSIESLINPELMTGIVDCRHRKLELCERCFCPKSN